tara:strand:+ start:1524 stop:1790 length:267 start_codon:yes stop_codon:yes gene_type:complete
LDFDANIQHLQSAFWTILMAAGPVLAIALAAGLTIGILQAATSINEMTLSFVPKIVIVLITLAVLASYLMTELVDYYKNLFEVISDIK